MDLIATVEGKNTTTDPVVIVLDIGWMRGLIRKNKKSFVVLINALYSADQYDELDIKYDLDDRAGYGASEEIILEWESNLQKMLAYMPNHRDTWNWIIANVPTKVFHGFDMAIGGEHGPYWLELIESLDRKIDRIVLITKETSIILAYKCMDDDKSIKVGGSEYEIENPALIITPYTDDAVEVWGEWEDIFAEGRGYLPLALYQLMKLSDLGEPCSINYHRLRI